MSLIIADTTAYCVVAPRGLAIKKACMLVYFYDDVHEVHHDLRIRSSREPRRLGIVSGVPWAERS